MMKPIFKLVSRYEADIRMEMIGDKYRILFVSGNFHLSMPVGDEEYLRYRNTFYLSPGKAKNELLDKLSFAGTPFCRKDFNFVDLIELSPEAEKEMMTFIETLDHSIQDIWL